MDPVALDILSASELSAAASEPVNVLCTRSIAQGKNGGLDVQVRIEKPGVSGFAKLQESLPAGYTATAIESGGSSFSVAEGKAKFVWTSIPENSPIMISYQLVADQGSSGGVQDLAGEFTYLLNNATQKTKVQGDHTFNPAMVTVASAEPPLSAVPTPTHTIPAKSSSEPSTTRPAVKPGPAAITSDALYFRVQIGAFRTVNSVKVIAHRFKLKEGLEMEMNNALTKFMVGKFTSYKEAASKREEMRKKGIEGPFVVAYQSGQRISLDQLRNSGGMK